VGNKISGSIGSLPRQLRKGKCKADQKAASKGAQYESWVGLNHRVAQTLGPREGLTNYSRSRSEKEKEGRGQWMRLEGGSFRGPRS